MSDLATPRPDPNNKPASVGKTVMAAGGTFGAAVIVLLYAAKHLGFDDMTPEVATGIITLATTATGAIMHQVQRNTEAKGN